MTRIILKYRWIIIIVSLLLSLAGVLQLPRMETDSDIKNYIPDDLVSSTNTNLIESEFGNQEMLLIIFRDSLILEAENLKRIKEIDRSLGRLSSVDKTISLFNTKRIYSEDGTMYVDPAVSRIPGSNGDIEKLKELLASNDLAMGVVVSEDFTMSAIAVSPVGGITEKELLHEVDSVVNLSEGKAEILFGGLPYIRKAVMEDVRKDGLILIPLALLIMLLFLWFSFRELKGVVLPFAVVVLSIAIAMGLAPLLGWKLSVLSLLVPIMLIAVANDYGIHLIAKYQELRNSPMDLSMSNISKEIVRKLRLPILFTGLTTIAGMLGLLTHSIIPAKHVGVLASVGISFAIAFSLFFLPAWLSFLNKSAAKTKRSQKESFIDKFLVRTSAFVQNKQKAILITAVFVTLIIGAGIFRIKVDGNQENFFPSRHPVKIASEVVNSNFGGSQTISILIRGDIKDPGTLKTINMWASELKECQGVDDVFSIGKVIKEISKSVFDESEIGYNEIPRSREGVAQLIELYNMSGDPDDFEQLVDLEYTTTHMMIRFSDPETIYINEVLDKIENMKTGSDLEVIKGGYAYVMSEFSDEIVRGQITSLIFAILVVFILLSIIFRSVQGGALSSMPILVSVIFLLGFMGYTGITLNPATALLSSVMIGIGVDYTIHFIWRYRDELLHRTHNEAIRTALTTTGKGIVINALSVIAGFSVLIISGFTSIRHFGFIILISIGVCLVASLVIIPAIMLQFKPAFVEKRQNRIFKKSTNMNKIMRRAVIIIVLATLALLANGQSPDAVELIKKSNSVLKVESFESRSTLIIRDSKGKERRRENITASRKYKDGTVKRLIKFNSPPDIKGTTMLIYDYELGTDDMWIYLPALKKSRRMVSRDKSKSFMGSDFSNSDMSSPPVEDFSHSLLNPDSKDNIWIVESRPVNEDKESEYGYMRRLNYINRTDYTVSKMEFYNFEDDLFKTIIIEDLYKLDDGRFIVSDMSATNHLKNRSSRIVLSDISAKTAVGDELFNVANIGR